MGLVQAGAQGEWVELTCYCNTHRNEGFQEELWKQSFEFLKDHLSPDTIEKCGPKVGDRTAGEEPEAGGEATANH